MASFDCLVDTNPMAASVDKISSHVNGTTAAVAAMQAAVIIAEKESADNICRNVDKGFYYLIRSQITTKMSQRFSEINAKFVMLSQMAKALDDKKNRMESDMARLKTAYYKTFHSIDKALENRITEIDRDATRLADIRKNLITGRLLKSVPQVMCFEKESENISQMAFTARIKNKTGHAIENLGCSIDEKRNYAKQLSSILDDKDVDAPVQEYIPVLLASESSMLAENTDICQVFISDVLDGQLRSAIENEALKSFNETTFSNNGYERDEIERAFYTFVSTLSDEPRVRDTLVELYNKGGRE